MWDFLLVNILGAGVFALGSEVVLQQQSNYTPSIIFATANIWLRLHFKI